MSAQPWTRPKAGRELGHLAASGNQDALQELLGELYVDAVAMCTENDLPRIARAQGQVTRWLTQLLDDDATVSDIAIKQLRILATMLDTGWRTASLRAHAKQQARVATTLRQQILDLLDAGPVRPSEIARRVARDPAQVSRALRALAASGQVQRIVPEGQDQRAVVYMRAPLHQPALVA